MATAGPGSWVTAREAALRLGVKDQTLRAWLRRRNLAKAGITTIDTGNRVAVYDWRRLERQFTSDRSERPSDKPSPEVLARLMDVLAGI